MVHEPAFLTALLVPRPFPMDRVSQKAPQKNLGITFSYVENTPHFMKLNATSLETGVSFIIRINKFKKAINDISKHITYI